MSLNQSLEPSHPLANHPLTIEGEIMSRLEKLTVEELANCGRPRGKQSRFLKVDGEMFIYETLSKHIARHAAPAARELLKRKRDPEKQTVEEFRAELHQGFIKLRTVRMCLTRKKVASNAVMRIKQSLTQEKK